MICFSGTRITLIPLGKADKSGFLYSGNQLILKNPLNLRLRNVAA
jgi:hypothetical protein